MIPIDFILYLTNFITPPNPMLLMAAGDDFPTDFCSGASFAVSCIEIANQEALSILDHISSLNVKGKMINPIVLSDGNHEDLISELNKDPLAFSQNGLWFMPIEYMSLIDLRLDSKIFFYSANSADGFDLIESYAIKGGTPIAKTLDVWHPGVKTKLNQGQLSLATSIMGRRPDLQGAVLRHSWFEDPPYVKHVIDESGQVVSTVGYNAALLTELQGQMNFSIEDVPPTIPHWGRFKNGSWHGIVGMLVDRDIDVSAVGILMMPERLAAIDFCWPTFSEEITLMTVKSTRSKLNVWVFMEIFPMAVWVISLALIILATLFFSVASKLPISESFALMVRLGLQMGYQVLTPNRTTKVLLLVSAMCLNLVFIFFTCDLTTRMTVEPPKLDIRSFEDVTRKGYMVVTASLNHEKKLKTALKDSAMKEVAENNIINFDHDVKDRYRPTRLFVNGHWDDKVVLYGTYDPHSDNELENQLIGLKIEEAYNEYEGIGLQKYSEFTELFNYHIMKLFEMGMVDRLMRKHVIKHDKEYGIAEPITLGYENLFFPFGIILLGVILAGVAVFGESIIKRMVKLVCK